jgi:hypothetical protein
MAADLASIADVKRILRIESSTDPVIDARLQAGLDVMEEWVLPKLKYVGKEGAWCEVYFDISEDATLRLPANDITITKVNVFEYPSSFGIPLSPIELGLGHGFDQDDQGNLMLRPSLYFSPFQGAVASRPRRTYSRVEVHYLGSGVVPRTITEGIAFLAAGYYQDGPRILAGLKSEKIGEYSYTLADRLAPDEADYVAQGLWFLGPQFKRQRVAVI